MNDWIDKLQLQPHPEGGYFKQVYGNDETGEKSISTIYYLLEDEQFSSFHRLHGMVEIWYFHAGAPLNIYVIDTEGGLMVHRLSPDGEMQVVIQPEQWFAAEIVGCQGYTLVGCAVAPAFSFENFELADGESLAQQYPQHRELIGRLCTKVI